MQNTISGFSKDMPNHVAGVLEQCYGHPVEFGGDHNRNGA